MWNVGEMGFSKQLIPSLLLILSCVRCIMCVDTLQIQEQLSACSCKTNKGTIDLSPLDTDPKPR